MPAGKTHQSNRTGTGQKSKEKALLDLNEIDKNIQKSAPKYNDKFEFEAVYFLTAVTFITFQYVHIYRLSFYNYDFKLYIYSLLILFRRLLLKLRQEKEVTDPLQREASTHIIKVGFYIWGFNILYLTYQLIAQNTWTSVFFIIYYFLMVVLASVFLYKDQRYDNVIHEMNFLFKSTLFRSFEVLYFSLLLPLKCHEENLSYNLLASIYIGFMALFNTAIYNIFFNVCYRCEEMRKQSKTLGDWRSIKLQNKDKQNIEEWSMSRSPYRRDAIVSFGKKYYRAVSESNAAVPGNLQFKLIYRVFHNHRRTRVLLIIAMCISIIIQNILLINSNRGTVYIMALLMSFFVFFFMIKLDRRLLRLFK